MTDRQSHINSLFLAALKIESPDERVAFLDEACGGQGELRDAVDRLLRLYQDEVGSPKQPETALEQTILKDNQAGESPTQGPDDITAAHIEASHSQLGDTKHSVLDSLGLTPENVPHIMLRDSGENSNAPIARSQATESQEPIVAGRYQLQGEIDRGGMGAIHKGRDTDLGRDLAIKVLLDAHKDNPHVVQRFVEEAQIGGQLQHPGIAPVYELGQFADQRPFFSMKLVKGKTLCALLSERQTPSEDRGKFLGIFEQICQTMAYVHSRGVIHRDLKPANIMVGAFGEVQVMDWGLAKVLTAASEAVEKNAQDEQQQKSIIQTMRSGGSDVPGAFGSAGSETQAGSVLGTPAFMPPEQALGEVDRLDERADVFGLGGILAQILTGKPPYTGTDDTVVFRQAVRGKLDDCMTRLDACGADEQLLEIARSCLRPEPDDRWKNAAVVADKVSEYLESAEQRLRLAEVGKAEEAARAEEATRTAAAAKAQVIAERRSRRLQLGMAVIVLLFTIAGAATTAYFLRQQKLQIEEVELAYESKSDYLYVAHLQMAEQAWRDGEVGRVRELLDQHQLQAKKDRRTFEWYYYDRLCRQANASPVMEYGDIISNLAVAPNGEYVALAGDDSNIQIFDLQTYERLTTLSGHQSKVITLQISPDSRTLVTCDEANTFRVWQREGDDFQTVLEGFSPRKYETRLSPDARYLAVPRRNEISIYDLTEVNSPKTLEVSNRLQDLQWLSGEGELVVALSDGTIDLWDVGKGQLQTNVLKLNEAASSIAISEDSKLLAVGNNSGVQVYSLSPSQRGTLVHDLGRPEGEFGYLFSFRSAVTVVTNQGTTIYDLESGQPRGKLPLYSGMQLRLIPSPDGSVIASVGEDHLVTLWDANTGRLQNRIKGHSNVVYGVGFDPQGRVVSGSRDKTARVSSPERFDGSVTLQGHEGWVWSVAFSRSGKMLASSSGDSNVILWDVESGTEVGRFVDHQQSVQYVTFSPTSDLLASASRDRTIKLWDTKTRSMVGEFLGHEGGVNSLDFSPDGRQLVSGGDDGAVMVWDVASRKIVAQHKVDSAQIWAVAFASDGSVVFGGTNEGLYAWRFAEGETAKKFHEGEGNITSLRFSPDGKMLSCTASNGAIIVFDYERRGIRSQPTAHNSDAMSADCSPDGRTLISCGSDGKIRFWYLDINEPTIQIDAHDNHIHSVAFSPDGKRIASGSWDNTIKIWSQE